MQDTTSVQYISAQFLPWGGAHDSSFISTASIVHQFPRRSCFPNTFFPPSSSQTRCIHPYSLINRWRKQKQTNKTLPTSFITFEPRRHTRSIHSLLLAVRLSLRSLLPRPHSSSVIISNLSCCHRCEGCDWPRQTTLRMYLLRLC